jgi:hypothetical protein
VQDKPPIIIVNDSSLNTDITSIHPPKQQAIVIDCIDNTSEETSTVHLNGIIPARMEPSFDDDFLKVKWSWSKDTSTFRGLTPNGSPEKDQMLLDFFAHQYSEPDSQEPSISYSCSAIYE